MRIFKFSGNVKESATFRTKAYIREFQGEFIQEENDEIVGIMDNGNSAIKGLFLEDAQLIFIEITSEGHVRGYAFKDIHKTGYFDKCDWLCGLFSGEGGKKEAKIEVEEEEYSRKHFSKIKNAFRKNNEGIDDWNQYYFKHVQELRNFIDFKE